MSTIRKALLLIFFILQSGTTYAQVTSELELRSKFWTCTVESAFMCKSTGCSVPNRSFDLWDIDFESSNIRRDMRLPFQIIKDDGLETQLLAVGTIGTKVIRIDNNTFEYSEVETQLLFDVIMTYGRCVPNMAR